MSLILAVAKCDFRLTWKDKSVLIWIFLMPLAFMFVFGQLNRGGGSSTPKARLTVENNDPGFIGKDLVKALEAEKLHIVDSDSLGPDSDPVRTLIIPENFSRDILSREKTGLILRKEEGSNVEAGEVVSVSIARGMIRTVASVIEVESDFISRKTGVIGISGDTLFGNLQAVSENIEGAEAEISESLDSILTRSMLVGVGSEVAGKRKKIPTGYQGSVPGNLVMFVLMGMVFSGMVITEERNQGLLRRMGMTLAGKKEVVIGKLLGRILVTAIQISVLLIIGKFLFNISVGSDIPALALLMLAFAFCCGSISILFGSLFRNPDQMTGVAVTFTLVLSALGGCWWPLEVVSRPFRIIAFMLPTGWAMDGIHKLISFGYGMSAVIGHIVILILFGLVFISFASKNLRWEMQGK